MKKNSLRILIRADASTVIGSGHVMRTLALAGTLSRRGAEIVFVCRDIPGNCLDIIGKQGYSLIGLTGTGDFDLAMDAEQTVAAIEGHRPDWLIVDHYGVGAEWEQCLRPYVERIMVIDDMADRRHDCDVLLDQNLHVNMEKRYDKLVPASCRLFLGPQYALLREEFVDARRSLRSREGVVRRVLVFFGGSDPSNETEKTLDAIQLMAKPEIVFDVVVGAANPNSDKIRKICVKIAGVNFYSQVDNMAELMCRADLSVGAGGSTTWERCYLGLPTLVVVVAENQSGPVQAAAHAGLVCYLGESAAVSVSSLTESLEGMLQQPDKVSGMAQRCLSFMTPKHAVLDDDISNLLCEIPDAS